MLYLYFTKSTFPPWSTKTSSLSNPYSFPSVPISSNSDPGASSLSTMTTSSSVSSKTSSPGSFLFNDIVKNKLLQDDSSINNPGLFARETPEPVYFQPPLPASSALSSSSAADPSTPAYDSFRRKEQTFISDIRSEPNHVPQNDDDNDDFIDNDEMKMKRGDADLAGSSSRKLDKLIESLLKDSKGQNRDQSSKHKASSEVGREKLEERIFSNSKKKPPVVYFSGDSDPNKIVVRFVPNVRRNQHVSYIYHLDGTEWKFDDKLDFYYRV